MTIATGPLEIGIEPYPGYRLRRPLGKGGFGAVWEAESADGTSVALKFLPCDHRAGASEENRSIQIVRQLQHPNLLPITNVWTYPGYLAVTMDLADGTLLDLLDVYQEEYKMPVPAQHLCPLLAQVASALDYLNTRQHHINGQVVAVQHCDVKPSNMLLFGDTVKVSDFSLTSITTSLMKNHRRAGTPDYVAPEVFQGRLSDRSDQYSLAVSYCVLRTGRLPFPEVPTPMPHQYTRPTPDLSLLTEEERPMVARALAPLPLDRWSSCGEFIGKLKKGAASRPVRHVGAKTQVKDRRRSPRFPCKIRTSWRLLGERDQQYWRACVQDVSHKGLGLVSNSYFQRGTVLVVKLDDFNMRFTRPLLVRVIRASKEPAGSWLLGCTFTNQISDEDIETLLCASARK